MNGLEEVQNRIEILKQRYTSMEKTPENIDEIYLLIFGTGGLKEQLENVRSERV